MLNNLLKVIDLGCWIACFWWMHRISSRQDAMLKELHDQGRRIEKLSKAEHDLIKDIHPKVENIEEGLDHVATVIRRKAEVLG